MRYQDLYTGQRVYHTRRRFWGTVTEFNGVDATIIVDPQYRDRMQRAIYYADIELLNMHGPEKLIYLVSPIFLEEHI